MCVFLSGFYDKETCEYLVVPGVDSHSQIAKVYDINEDDERYWRFECVPPSSNIWRPTESLEGWTFKWDEPTKTEMPEGKGHREALAVALRGVVYSKIPPLLSAIPDEAFDSVADYSRFHRLLKNCREGKFVLSRLLLYVQEENLKMAPAGVRPVIQQVISLLRKWANGKIDKVALKPIGSEVAVGPCSLAALRSARSAAICLDQASYLARKASFSATRSINWHVTLTAWAVKMPSGIFADWNVIQDARNRTRAAIKSKLFDLLGEDGDEKNEI